jgi:DNA-directed RNA polymerase II subunit RPB1
MTTCTALLETVASKRIANIQFGLLNPEKVRKQSVVEVTKTTLYHRQLPAYNGLNDLRMGTCDRRVSCGTCKNDVLNCVGHYGHIELAAPVYHVSMVNTLIKVLRCVCFFCSRLLVDMDGDARVEAERLQSLDAKDRLNYMVNLCKSRRPCMHCNGQQPKYVQLRTSVAIKTEFRAGAAREFECDEEREFAELPFTAAQARSILACMRDSDVALLGINPEYARPEWMILTVLQVPPPISRPSIMATDGSRARGQDDVTIKLQEILKANKHVQAALAAHGVSGSSFHVQLPAPVVNAIETLQQHVAQFMHYDSTPGAANSSAPPRANRPLRLIPARIKGKKGRFRGTLGGKRVDYSARTVVSPAPDYDIDEVGVPRVIAQHLTFPERVTDWNLDELSQRVANGPSHLFGATAVITPDGSLIDLSLLSSQNGAVQLQPGFVVERYLKNGDWVLFNRQPSLHRMSVMAHRVRIIPDKTFRLPICDTTPYNADFDGDEMNLHVLRTYEAVAEAKELMSVPTQMISPQSNKPIIGLVQDSLVSVYLLTMRDTFLTRAQVMQMVMPVAYPLFNTLPPPCILKPQPLWSGKQLFSLLFPRFSIDVTLPSGVVDGVDKRPDGVMDVAERRVIVRDGELLTGTLCKKTVGTSPGHILHLIIKDCGNQVGARFVGDAQRLLVQFMLARGFSVGVGDCLMGENTHAKVVGSINRSLAYVDEMMAANSQSDVLEACVTRVMTGVLTRVGAVVQENLPRSNQVHVMVTSGAKGSSVNIAQILGCVGQQSVEGGRIAPDIYGRTLPCYAAGQQTVESRGFVANSYGTGLTAQEYFFHAMGGREGLVDTAVKTASTGYIQRRLVKAKEGLQVRYDHTVRNTRDQIVQFYYGGDSFDPVFVEKHQMKTFPMSDAVLRSTFAFTLEELQAGVAQPQKAAQCWHAWAAALEAEAAGLLADRDQLRDAKLKLSAAPGAEVFITIAPARAVQRAARMFPTARSDVVHPDQVVQLVRRACSAISSARRNTACFITLAYLRSVLTLRCLVVEHRLSLAALEWLTQDVVASYQRSLVSCGEMVGTLGAASIGEPCTQMTLNTFHTAGVAEKAVTLGVPRLKELIDTTRPIKTPSLSVFFNPLYSASERMARMFGASLEYTVLQQVVLTSSVVEAGAGVEEAEDAFMMHAFRVLHGDAEEGADESQFVIRFVLNREALHRKQLTVVHVAQALVAYLKDNATVVRSEVNMMQWVVRVRMKRVGELLDGIQDVDPVERVALEHTAVKTAHDFLLDNVAIQGVTGISRAVVRQQQRTVVDGETRGLRCEKEWMADTDGTNLRAVLSLPCIDKQRTISNDIHEVLDVLGIEAAQQVLVEELRTVLTFDGSYVNERHLQLLADVMTLSGTLTAMTRHSMHKLGGSTYHHASFEETQDVLIQAAAFGQYDHISGVTENLMMGQLMPGGTGACDVIFSSSPPFTPAPVVKPLDLALGSASGTAAVAVKPLFHNPATTLKHAHQHVVKPLFSQQPQHGGDGRIAKAPLVASAVVERTSGVAPSVKKRESSMKQFIPLSPAMPPTGAFRPLSPLLHPLPQ